MVILRTWRVLELLLSIWLSVSNDIFLFNLSYIEIQHVFSKIIFNLLNFTKYNSN